MVGLIIGTGEVGLALFELLAKRHQTRSYDKAKPSRSSVPENGPVFQDVDILHVCIPYSEQFVSEVQRYIDMAKPRYCVVHSSVPVGTCAKIGMPWPGRPETVIFHSPVRGTHPDMRRGLMTFVKYLSSDWASREQFDAVVEYFTTADFKIKISESTRTTEAMKLLELARYGVYLAFAKEQEAICRQLGVSYDAAYLDFERTSNEGLREEGRADLQQPLLTPFKRYIGGHCTLENIALLLGQVEQPLLRKAYEVGRGTIIWPNCNIYPGAKIGKGCSVGQFTEIDNGVVIGNDVRVGAYCFITSGVTSEGGCFIAPRVSFSNDKHPPSKGEYWGTILVKRGAVIGMGAVVLPGVTIGERAVVGAGSVVTKDVPPGEVYYGVAAQPRGTRNGIYKPQEALTD